MKTLQQFEKGLVSIPTHVAWYLADLGEARGKQDLFTKQSPQKLKSLRQHAVIESAVSSNRIEGVEIDQKRVRALVLGKGGFRNRNEEEVRGYRETLDLIHTKAAEVAISEDTIKKLHTLCRGKIWDAGKYKEKDGDITERRPDGQVRVRFRAVTASGTPEAMLGLVELWHASLKEKPVHPLIALGAFNLDFLCIHPFRDGNGRVSRLLLLLQCYHLGFEVVDT